MINCIDRDYTSIVKRYKRRELKRVEYRSVEIDLATQIPALQGGVEWSSHRSDPSGIRHSLRDVGDV